MKKCLLAFLIMITILLTGCHVVPQKDAATRFMKSLQNRNFEKAAACCGFSKDKLSQQVVITLLLEQYGTTEHSIRDFKILSDTLLKEDEKAVVYMDLIYTNNTKEQNVPIYLHKMGRKWIVILFETP